MDALAHSEDADVMSKKLTYSQSIFDIPRLKTGVLSFTSMTLIVTFMVTLCISVLFQDNCESLAYTCKYKCTEY